MDHIYIASKQLQTECDLLLKEENRRETREKECHQLFPTVIRKTNKELHDQN